MSGETAFSAYNPAALVDLYQLTMAQAYWHEGMHGEAVFSLHFRDLPRGRNFVLAAGLHAVLDALESFRFDRHTLDYLAGHELFREDFLRWLEDLRLDATVRAVPEGTVVFGQEPLLEVTAPVIQGQLVESLIMNQIHVQSVLASGAARIVAAAGGRPVVDFALRRMHGSDAAVQGARAMYIGGAHATSNVLAGRRYGIPVTGTMAHSYVQAHADERAALRAFAELYPETTLLIDTWDALDGVDRVIALAREQGEQFSVAAIRIDSGDLEALAGTCRQRLDEAGLSQVRILVSGGLDEYRIARLVQNDAPIDGFGVGTHMGTGGHAPTLDLAYKLVAYEGRPCIKTSPGKPVYPGAKQVFRQQDAGRFSGDTVAAHDERQDGAPLLNEVMRDGQRSAPDETLADIRARAAAQVRALPEDVRKLEAATEPYRVNISPALRQAHEDALGTRR